MSASAPDRRRLLLAHSYYLRYDEKQWRKMKPYPPLSTLIAAAVMRERDFDVHHFDAMLAEGVHEFEAALERVRPGIVGILEDNFNFLTKMCTTRMRQAALDMVRAAKAHGCLVVVNGSDAIDHPEFYLDAGADAVIVGEVEPTLQELVAAWRDDAGASPDGVAGLALPGGERFASNGTATDRSAAANGGDDASIRWTAPRERLKDLDALPFPAWDLVDAERYRRAWTDAHGRLSWNMVASRGCPYKCNWCAKPLFGRLYTQRAPADVAEELRRLKDTVAPDHVWFADDIWGLTPQWIQDFATEVTRRDARTPFMIQSRVNLMTPESVAALDEAGAEEVWMGVESGSQKILDAMEKGSRVEEARSATRTLRARGIRACWFIQLGYLGEGWDDIVKTRELIREERPDAVGVSVSYPLPGTKFYDMVRSDLGPKQNWEHSDDLDMMFHGTFETGFYKRVRRLLHAEVDAFPHDISRAELDRRWTELEAERDAFRNPVAAGMGGG